MLFGLAVAVEYFVNHEALLLMHIVRIEKQLLD